MFLSTSLLSRLALASSPFYFGNLSRALQSSDLTRRSLKMVFKALGQVPEDERQGLFCGRDGEGRGLSLYSYAKNGDDIDLLLANNVPLTCADSFNGWGYMSHPFTAPMGIVAWHPDPLRDYDPYDAVLETRCPIDLGLCAENRATASAMMDKLMFVISDNLSDYSLQMASAFYFLLDQTTVQYFVNDRVRFALDHYKGPGLFSKLHNYSPLGHYLEKTMEVDESIVADFVASGCGLAQKYEGRTNAQWLIYRLGGVHPIFFKAILTEVTENKRENPDLLISLEDYINPLYYESLFQFLQRHKLKVTDSLVSFCDAFLKYAELDYRLNSEEGDNDWSYNSCLLDKARVQLREIQDPALELALQEAHKKTEYLYKLLDEGKFDLDTYNAKKCKIENSFDKIIKGSEDEQSMDLEEEPEYLTADELSYEEYEFQATKSPEFQTTESYKFPATVQATESSEEEYHMGQSSARSEEEIGGIDEEKSVEAKIEDQKHDRTPESVIGEEFAETAKVVAQMVQSMFTAFQWFTGGLDRS